MTVRQIEERLRAGDYDNETLVRWCRQRLGRLGETGETAPRRAGQGRPEQGIVHGSSLVSGTTGRHSLQAPCGLCRSPRKHPQSAGAGSPAHCTGTASRRRKVGLGWPSPMRSR